jgi:hypothetical protein
VSLWHRPLQLCLRDRKIYTDKLENYWGCRWRPNQRVISVCLMLMCVVPDSLASTVTGFFVALTYLG